MEAAVDVDDRSGCGAQQVAQKCDCRVGNRRGVSVVPAQGSAVPDFSNLIDALNCSHRHGLDRSSGDEVGADAMWPQMKRKVRLVAS